MSDRLCPEGYSYLGNLLGGVGPFDMIDIELHLTSLMCTFSFVYNCFLFFLQVSDTKKTSKVVLKVTLTKNLSL